MKFIDYLKQQLDPDREKQPLTDKIFMRSVVTSFVAIIACIVVFSASTYAWFNESVATTETITASVYTLSITTAPTSTTVTNTSGNSVYTLAGDTAYTVTVTTVDDETTGTTGYIKLKIGDQTLVSEQINKGDTLTFTLRFDSDTTVELIECWGISSIPSEDRHIIDGSSLGDPTP